MKILVNNEQEQALVKRFLEAMHELEGVTALVELDKEYCGQNPIMKNEDEDFMALAISNAQVEIDPQIEEIYLEETDNITGVCVTCGCETRGTFNGEAVSYADYLHLMQPESQKSWYCETCYYKEDNHE